MRAILSALLVVAALFAESTSVYAAAPRFIIVQGSLLDEPVLLDDWDENARLMLAISASSDIEVQQLEERRYLDLALFWGPDWADHPGRAEALSRLSSEHANQRGRFYPAVHSVQPALFLLENVDDPSGRYSLRLAEPRALAILEAHGIPVHIEREEASSLLTPLRLRWALLALAVSGVLLAALLVRRHRARAAIR